MKFLGKWRGWGLLLGSLVALPAQADVASLLPNAAPAAPPYVAPHRLFAVRLPPNWAAYTYPDKTDFVELRLQQGVNSTFLQIQRLAVGDGARPKQLLLRAVEQRLSKLSHFKETSRRDVVLDGIAGASLTGTFWYQGNAQYPRAVEEIYLIVGNEAFELHFECFAPLASRLASQVEAIYQSFVPRPPAEAPAAPMPSQPEDDSETQLDDLPF